ncbi:unnamed protein product [Rotaria sp. Silwood2]|nr:unnamed protein product [Rotaria sp. Silwood2]CAF2907695.1 unnamed protein product [Rotaria sp. Silwood2]CAF3357948.1 unnamed protein product [Rotaria sp. Silwood2]CAF4040133.1 unnamed protein product [Rotaria sp. Silwood2]CAF4358376.1 unnamed protein product [Rotaria sp. Silwood2]
MIEQKITSNDTMNKMSTFKQSRQIQIIKNFMYLISLFDFLLHYALMVEMDLFKQIYLSFRKFSESYSTAISLCELPIKKYLPFSLSQMSLYIFYFSILTLLLSTEAIRKSSSVLYRFYIIIKFIIAISSFFLCIIYTIVNQMMPFIQTSLIISRLKYENNSISLTIDTCLIYAREKIAIYILAISNVLICFISMECSKVFSFF